MIESIAARKSLLICFSRRFMTLSGSSQIKGRETEMGVDEVDEVNGVKNLVGVCWHIRGWAVKMRKASDYIKISINLIIENITLQFFEICFYFKQAIFHFWINIRLINSIQYFC